MATTRYLSILAVILGIGFVPLAARADFAVGKPAPNVPLVFLDGRSAELGAWLGRQPVYLKIWATWCGTCRQEMPHFQAAYENYGEEVAIFSVNAGFNDTAAEVREFNERYGLRMPSVLDASGDIGQAFDLVATPYHVLIDADGTVAHAGHSASDEVDEWLESMAGSRSASMARVAAEATGGTGMEAGIPGPGDPAPSFSARTASGASFELDAREPGNEPVYLLFFTTWCETYLAGDGDDEETARACSATREAVNRAIAESRNPPTVLGIASRMWTGTEEIAEYREQFETRYPVVLDETNDIFRRYGVREFPTLIVIADGRISARHSGALDALPLP